MTRWTCPACDRTFGRRHQSHVCAPAMSVDEWFAERPPEHRAICDAMVAIVEPLGPLDVEAVDVGVFMKHNRTFAELRPRKKVHLALSVVLEQRVESDRIYRTIVMSPTRVAQFVELRAPDDVDDFVADLLVASYVGTAR